MVQFYKENGQRVSYKDLELIGEGQYGTVFKVSCDECLKVYKGGQEVDDKIIDFIRELRLKRFYEIRELLYGRTGKFRAYTSRYYLPEEVDILTMPIDYTLNSLYDLFDSAVRLTSNNIFISDMHTGNIIMNLDGITVIDVDIYTFNKIFSYNKLKEKNFSSVRYLFTAMYLEALTQYHSSLLNFDHIEKIKGIFNDVTIGDLDGAYKKLSRYKYPIDYLKTRS